MGYKYTGCVAGYAVRVACWAAIHARFMDFDCRKEKTVKLRADEEAGLAEQAEPTQVAPMVFAKVEGDGIIDWLGPAMRKKRVVLIDGVED
jgi:hypothetical protein